MEHPHPHPQPSPLRPGIPHRMANQGSTFVSRVRSSAPSRGTCLLNGKRPAFSARRMLPARATGTLKGPREVGWPRSGTLASWAGAACFVRWSRAPSPFQDVGLTAARAGCAAPRLCSGLSHRSAPSPRIHRGAATYRRKAATVMKGPRFPSTVCRGQGKEGACGC